MSGVVAGPRGELDRINSELLHRLRQQSAQGRVAGDWSLLREPGELPHQPCLTCHLRHQRRDLLVALGEPVGVEAAQLSDQGGP